MAHYGRLPLTLFAGFAFAVIFVGALVLVVLVNRTEFEEKVHLAWWQRTVIYHIYVPSFFDTDGDGVGDLQGVTAKIPYIKSLGVDSIWLSPFNTFGGKDMGNDVINHTTVDPLFGTEESLERMLADLDSHGFKVIVEFIPNHTSNQSEWFQASSNPGHPLHQQYRNYYIWRNATTRNGTTGPPNNWKSVTGQSAWSYNPMRQQYYLHHYLPEMPDLNLLHTPLRKQLKEVFRFWLNRTAVKGLHIGSFDLLIENENNGDVIEPDVTKCLEFLQELHQIAAEFRNKDGMGRLMLLELLKGPDIVSREMEFRKHTSLFDEIPFSFGNVHWTKRDEELGGLPGWKLRDLIYDYQQPIMELEMTIRKERQKKKKGSSGSSGASEANERWPCWEMNNHEMVVHGDGGYGRIYESLHELVLVMSLLLPGTAVVYYGDEIGMNGAANEIPFSETKDPYALPPYGNASNYHHKSRDPNRTPMQWTNETNANFTTAAKPWIPILKDVDKINVAFQEDQLAEKAAMTHLTLFREVVQLRQYPALHSGRVFYPFQDADIFTFLRKEDSNRYGYFVAINIGGLRDRMALDFTEVWPTVPEVEASVLFAMGQNSRDCQTCLQQGDKVSLRHIDLKAHTGIVLRLDFESDEGH